MRFNVGRFTSFSTEIESFPKIFLYSMKIKVQTRKLAAGCSKQCFEVADGS
ncbi:chlorohydrolase [Streptococcus pneumoniae]|nr:chlorohydrolase [Streptococcus pneumoniae GA07228]EHZ35360.1 chlorohydrolase [Streptococcus pneumoniae GA19101]EHZ64234.1 chlorohydrolase [Streptococcus pneumoniae GA47597]MBS0665312.1 chlorohydrolase [Streptococcus pneumoniae]MBS0670472.1 chlorohydrolase [Streptococcus pneumoniae]